MAQISPWDGFPKTRLEADENGKRCFIVTPRVLTPMRAKAAEAMTLVMAVVLTAIGFIYLSGRPTEPEAWKWFVVPFLPWMLFPLIYWFSAAFFAKETKIVLTEKRFEVHGLITRRVYDRTLPHSLSLFQHDWAEAEMRENDYAIRKAAREGKVIQKTPYYADSAVVSFDYLGQRNDVLVAYPKTTAHNVLTRLQACDAVLNRQIGSGDGITTDPSDQWRDQPGDIPDDE